MKKSVLFVMNNLNCGGAEKALISLLDTIDYSKYDVDLFLMKHEGLFLSKIPNNVNLLEEPNEYKYFDMSIKLALLDCLKNGRLDIAISRLLAGIIIKTEKNRVRCEQRVWMYISKSLKNINKKYDIAVGYLEKTPIYFCVDKVDANTKIGFIHNDYDQLGMDPLLDQPYFERLENIVTVSEECGKILRNRFPMYNDKVKVMYNIVSPSTINKMSLEQGITWDEGVKIVSVGRLNKQKNFELAVETCKELVKNGYSVKWYIIGEGEEREELERIIGENNLQETFILLGIKENPYPYIKEADIYVQPSRFEGKSIAIDEAKILHKPIVVTNFSTAKDQITNHDNGLIVEMNSKSLYEGIASLINNEALREHFTCQLSNEQLGTESEIHKLYEMFN
ncbi:glycosyltransferase [Paenibacillus alginolyticus]|uniref:Glycosyltransferase n=1 Tax=Paenibacillus alginolyticus TaxID=59839 RepID=A0ABT4G8Y2_9BACL|nr:glycosyltransferase [Paenibacillus alginolyticus]MCY9692629.1 glycosyltransferase [Paenibacillus alginolyticus]MEC0143836.1 glycosyltransferase [Paenibacillus alginolyticus]